MLDPPLDVRDRLTGIELVPAPIEVLGREAKLDDQIAGQVLGLDLAALFPPQPDQCRLVRAHDDPGIGAADKAATIGLSGFRHCGCSPFL